MSALTRGFQILGTVAQAGTGLTFSEIVEASGVPKASAHRFLRELVDLSALSYDESTRRYRGGLALASLGASVTRNYDIRQVARPCLEALHQRTGCVTTLGIRDGQQGIYIDKIEPADLVLRLHSEIGKSFPLHCTAMGKVLLAYSDSATVAKVMRRKLRTYTANTITDKQKLRVELDHIAENGIAMDREEITRGLVCIAAPIYGIDGTVDAAISCTMPSFDASSAKRKHIESQVRLCARKASNR